MAVTLLARSHTDLGHLAALHWKATCFPVFNSGLSMHSVRVQTVEEYTLIATYVYSYIAIPI